MAWLADAHREWHWVNPDRPWDCPLDCGMAERDHEYEDEESGNFSVPVPEAPPVWGGDASVDWGDFPF